MAAVLILTLRPYQQDGIDQIGCQFRQRKRRILYVLPTAGGKTQIFCRVARGAVAKGNRVLILCHRDELVEQIIDALQSNELKYGVMATGYTLTKEMVIVASVQTLIHRLDKIETPDLICVDESHHVRSNTWDKILLHFKDARVLGVTATPIRQSGEALGQIFDAMVVGPSMRWLIENDYLSPYKLYVPPTVDTSGLHIKNHEFVAEEVEQLVNKPKVIGSCVEHHRQYTHGQRGIAFCSSVKNTQLVADEFRANGYQAYAISGKTDRTIRKAVIADFRAGNIEILTGCQIFEEGFDAPGAVVGHMLNPTQSLRKYMQENGRLFRKFPGKDFAWLFDYTGNVYRHGLPDAERPWELSTADEGSKRKSDILSVRVCPKCWASMRSAQRICECGYEFPVEGRTIRQQKGTLAEVDQDEFMTAQHAKAADKQERSAEEFACKTLDDWHALAKKRGHKAQWAWMRFKTMKPLESNDGRDGAIRTDSAAVEGTAQTHEGE
jgi:DNA repair protein RadD